MDSARACVYVAVGAGGLLKVGMTKNPNNRLPGLRQEFKSKGDVLTTFTPCALVHGTYGAEYSLIRFCTTNYQQHSGREWFTGADPAAVVELAKRLTHELRSRKYVRPPTVEQIAAMRAESAERNRLDAIRHAEWKADYLRRSAAWRAKRHKSERVIQAFVTFAQSINSGLVGADPSSHLLVHEATVPFFDLRG